MGGSSERVIPLLVGTVIFLFLLATIIAYLGPIAPAAGDNGPTGGLNITGGYSFWTPGSREVGWANATHHYNYYPLYSENFTHSGESQVTVYSIRNSTDIAMPPIGIASNYIMVDQHYGFLGFNIYRFPVSYATLASQANTTGSSNVSINFQFGDKNFTLFIETGPLGGHSDATTFTTQLFSHNRFNESLAFNIPPGGPSTTGDVLGMVWWILTLNVAWIPTYPLVGYGVGLVLDVIIVLCVIRIIWGG